MLQSDRRGGLGPGLSCALTGVHQAGLERHGEGAGAGQSGFSKRMLPAHIRLTAMVLPSLLAGGMAREAVGNSCLSVCLAILARFNLLGVAMDPRLGARSV